MNNSVTKNVVVEASREVAFRVFTQRMSSWWPEGHHLGKSPLVAVVVEPRAGGRWHERCADGSECEWGRVLAWEPPNRVVLAWQLTADFAYDPTFETEIEVRFKPEGATRTRVELEHRNLDRYGAKHSAMIEAFDSKGGWQNSLDAFMAAARSAGPTASTKQTFFLRLNPPRPSFSTDMNEKEKRAMQDHVAYWTEKLTQGTMIAFGPVADPSGGYGIGIIETDDRAALEKLLADDPAIRAAIGARYDVLPMPRVLVRA